MDSLPFNKIIVDSRHASVGTSTNFEITLPETMSLPQNAACYVTDVVISNSFSTLGTASGTINHTFYFIERIGNLTALNRVYLDETKMYEGNKLAAEIQTKMNAGSLGGTGGIYTVTYDFDLGTMVFSRTVNGDDSFIIVNDDLLADPQFQTLLPFKRAQTKSIGLLTFVIQAAPWLIWALASALHKTSILLASQTRWLCHRCSFLIILAL